MNTIQRAMEHRIPSPAMFNAVDVHTSHAKCKRMSLREREGRYYVDCDLIILPGLRGITNLSAVGTSYGEAKRSFWRQWNELYPGLQLDIEQV